MNLERRIVMIFTKQKILEYKEKRRYFLTWRSNIKPYYIRDLFYKNGEEAYCILYDDATEEKTVLISKLLSTVFFPDLQVFRLYNPKLYPHKRRWKIED